MSKLPQSIHNDGPARDLALRADLTDEITALEAPVGVTAMRGTDIQALARAFRAGTGSFDPDALQRLAVDPLRNFYAPDHVNGLIVWLKNVVVRGGRVLVQGTRSGVGSSQLANDFGRVWNYWAERHHVAERVVRFNLIGIDTPKQLFQSLGRLVGRELTPAQYRMKPRKNLAEDFVADAVNMRYTTIVMDHLQLVSPAVRSAVLDLMDYGDPAGDVPTSTSAYSKWQPRIGFVLVCNRALDELFGHDRRGFRMLESGVLQMLPYSKKPVLAEAIRRAGPEFSGLDVHGNPEHEFIVARILVITRGLIAHIAPLLQVMSILARYRELPVLSIEVLKKAEEYGRDLRKADFGRRDPRFPDSRGVTAVPIPRESPPDGAPPETHKKASRREVIAAKQAELEATKKENDKIQRRRSWTLSGS